ncbi:MAG: DNA mismatch repair endonuclease MutL [Chitinophagales bacterium]|nr:DNA mismatch repair endonuclease MutL [Chitinophagales bacterium]
MSDIIKLLPASLANQIAAGEVIQRPASLVKELLENSIDAGAQNIQLIIKDAGRTLVQVVDDGIGMSLTDARMCFERHATSKIQNINDLFALYTMGFRGEAMASIAAVAQVELKTCNGENPLGTHIRIDASKVIGQEPCQHPIGTTIQVKNLFYNVPARRSFLKSNAVEMRHILDEFTRVALAHPHIFFTLHHNGLEVFHLKSGNLRQRIVSLFGKIYNEKLVPVEETTDFLSIRGFIGKPELSKKTRGEQFFFVNNRFIRNNFLHHAIQRSYDGIISEKSFPFYILFIDIDPAKIDINVHPTKQEIKFEDERAVYLVLQAAAKHGLAQYSVTPTIDFEHESRLQDIKAFSNSHSDRKEGSFNAGFQPSHKEENKEQHWEKLFETDAHTEQRIMTIQSKASFDQYQEPINDDLQAKKEERILMQLHQKYILTQIKSGIILVDQSRAHQRVLFEQYLDALHKTPAASQQTLFPKTIELHPSDAELLREMQEDLLSLGFDIQNFGQHSFVIHGVPLDLIHEEEQQLIDGLLEQYKLQSKVEKIERRDQLARSLALQMAIKSGKPLNTKEMAVLIDELFACEQPNYTPTGEKTFITFTLEELAQAF